MEIERTETEYTEEEMDMYESFKKIMSESDYRPLKFKELCNLYEITKEDKKDEFLGFLNRLTDEVKLIKTKNNRYMLPPANMLVGIYTSTRRGFGFVSVQGEDEDYFDYVRKLSGDPVARTVKRADLLHNLDSTRLSKVSEKDSVEKYY